MQWVDRGLNGWKKEGERVRGHLRSARWDCIKLKCTALHSFMLHYHNVLYSLLSCLLHCTELHCIKLFCVLHHCTAMWPLSLLSTLHCTAVLWSTGRVLQCKLPNDTILCRPSCTSRPAVVTSLQHSEGSAGSALHTTVWLPKLLANHHWLCNYSGFTRIVFTLQLMYVLVLL